MAQDKILIVDNEYELIWTTDSTKVAELVREENSDLIHLDVVILGLGGIEVCHSIREFIQVLILFVSSKDEEYDLRSISSL